MIKMRGWQASSSICAAIFLFFFRRTVVRARAALTTLEAENRCAIGKGTLQKYETFHSILLSTRLQSSTVGLVIAVAN